VSVRPEGPQPWLIIAPTPARSMDADRRFGAVSYGLGDASERTHINNYGALGVQAGAVAVNAQPNDYPGAELPFHWGPGRKQPT
jgi:hypothetical protein